MLCCLTTLLRAQPAVQISGSTTVHAALQSKQSQLEKLIGRKIEFKPTGSVLGLVSLAAGRADIAMLSSPLADIAQKLNDKNPDSIDISQYQATEIGRAKIAFVVHPRNPARELSAVQIVDILTGKTTNWKDVGGKDAAILVVAQTNTGSSIRNTFLGGVPIISSARLMPNANQIPPVVSQDENAIGILSVVHVRGLTSLVRTDAEIFAPLFLVTKGEPKPHEKALIEAARTLLTAPL